MENDLRARRSSKARLELRTSLFYTAGQAATEKKDGSPKVSEEKETILFQKKFKCKMCGRIFVQYYYGSSSSCIGAGLTQSLTS